MDKLQWFKFTPSDWMMGKIQRCSEVTQARFMRLSCLYWNKECVLSLEDAEIEIDKEHLKPLIDKKIVKELDGFIAIEFLDDQMDNILETSEKRRAAVNKRWEKLKQKDTSVLQKDTSVLQSDTDKIREEGEEKREEPSLVESIDFNNLLLLVNQTGNRKFTVVPDKAKREFNKRLKEGYTKENIRNAIINAHLSDHHKESGFKWLTLEFFSRQKTLDQYGYELKPTKTVNNNPVIHSIFTDRDDT